MLCANTPARRAASLIFPFWMATVGCVLSVPLDEAPLPPTPDHLGGSERAVADVQIDPLTVRPGDEVTVSVTLPRTLPELRVTLRLGEADPVDLSFPDGLHASVEVVAGDEVGDEVALVDGRYVGGVLEGAALLTITESDGCGPEEVREAGHCVQVSEGHVLRGTGQAIVNWFHDGRTMIHPRRDFLWGDLVVGCHSDSVGAVRLSDFARQDGDPDQPHTDPTAVPIGEGLLGPRNLDYCQDLAFDPTRGLAIAASRGTTGQAGGLSVWRVQPLPGLTPAQVDFLHMEEDPSGFEGVTLVGDLLHATRKPGTVVTYRVEDNGDLSFLSELPIPGAVSLWSLTVVDDLLLVTDAGSHAEDHQHPEEEGAHDHAAQGRLYVLDIAVPADPVFLSEFATSGLPRGLASLGQGVVAVANGAQGIDLIDHSDPIEPRLLHHAETPGSVMALSADAGYLAAADWSGVRLYDAAERGTIRLLDATELPSDERFMDPNPRGGLVAATAVVLSGNRMVVGDFNSLWSVTLVPGASAPRAVVLDRFSYVDVPGDEGGLTLWTRFHNPSRVPLDVSLPGGGLVESADGVNSVRVPPGGTSSLSAHIDSPTAVGEQVTVRFDTTDPTAPVRATAVFGIDGLEPGDAAPAWELPGINLCDGEVCDQTPRCVRSADATAAGKPILLAYFASW